MYLECTILYLFCPKSNLIIDVAELLLEISNIYPTHNNHQNGY